MFNLTPGLCVTFCRILEVKNGISYSCGKVGLKFNLANFNLDFSDHTVQGRIFWVSGPAHWELLARGRALDNQVLFIFQKTDLNIWQQQFKLSSTNVHAKILIQWGSE